MSVSWCADIDQRKAQVLAEGDIELVQRILADSGASARLDALLHRCRVEAPDAILAAAWHVNEPDLALAMLHQSRIYPNPVQDPLHGRSAHELDVLFDHSDPAGPLPIEATISAKRMLFGPWSDEATPPWIDWPLRRREVLAEALSRLAAKDSTPLPPEFTAEGIDVVDAESGAGLLVLTVREGRSRYSFSTGAFESKLQGDASLPEPERRRRLLRILEKATGHVDGGEWSTE